MKKADFPSFAEVMAKVCVISGREASGELVNAYFEVLQDLDIQDVSSAFMSHLKTVGTFPNPAQVINLIQGSDKEKAIEAYDKALFAAEKFGAYESVQFSDPAITEAIKSMGGWIAFCSMNHTEWTRKEFERIYSAKSKVMLESSVLHGYHAIGNNSNGFDHDKVRFIASNYKTQKIGISGREGHMSKSALEFMGVRK